MDLNEVLILIAYGLCCWVCGFLIGCNRKAKVGIPSASNNSIRDAIVELFDKWVVDGLPRIETANGAKAFVDWVQQQHP